MTTSSNGDDAGRRPSVTRRAGVAAIGAAIGAVGGYVFFGDAIGAAASAGILALGFTLGLGGGHGAGVDGGGGE